jgi:hypothetical protein
MSRARATAQLWRPGWRRPRWAGAAPSPAGQQPGLPLGCGQQHAATLVKKLQRVCRRTCRHFPLRPACAVSVYTHCAAARATVGHPIHTPRHPCLQMKQHNNHPAWLIRPASSKAPALASIYSMHSSAGAMDKSQTVKAAAKHSASSRLVSTLKRALSGACGARWMAQGGALHCQEPQGATGAATGASIGPLLLDAAMGGLLQQRSGPGWQQSPGRSHDGPWDASSPGCWRPVTPPGAPIGTHHHRADTPAMLLPVLPLRRPFAVCGTGRVHGGAGGRCGEPWLRPQASI